VTAIEKPYSKLLKTSYAKERWSNDPFSDVSDAQVDFLLQELSPVYSKYKIEIGSRPVVVVDEESLVTVKAASLETDSIRGFELEARCPLEAVLKYDCRINEYVQGDIIIREGEYGGSCFYILDGDACVVLNPSLPEKMLGRISVDKKSTFTAIKSMFGSKIPEFRAEKSGVKELDSEGYINLFDFKNSQEVFDLAINKATGAQKLSKDYDSLVMGAGSLFGEVAALARTPRTATVFASTDKVRVLEVRWQGIRDISQFDQKFKKRIRQAYQDNLVKHHLQRHPIFSNMENGQNSIELEKQISLKMYGDFDWASGYKSDANAAVNIADEEFVVKEGDYSEYVFLVVNGFGRVSERYGHGYKTVRYLESGDLFGAEEFGVGVASNLIAVASTAYKYSLSVLSYLHVLRIPKSLLDNLPEQGHQTNIAQVQFVNPNEDNNTDSKKDGRLLEWAIDKRYIIGTQSMLIDTERCVGCDDCVKACADSHDGNPRFIRQGETVDNWMVAKACMHCSDPVCLVGCPTGAIQRAVDGTVVIDDDNCIGCQGCANACPFDNIRMVETRDAQGELKLKADGGYQLKATKCDLCVTQKGGPACVNACPKDAIQRVNF
jgi:Fe-S-cluster-containing dehydrogenase component/CRP-like cAMP-binding protein